MDKIISKVYEIIKETQNFIEFEEQIQRFMYEIFSELLGDIFDQLDQAIVKKTTGWMDSQTKG